MTLNARHQKFWDLHQSGCFVIPNPWDAGTAQMMAGLGAQALATSSGAHAFTLGRTDPGGVTRDEALAHAELIVAATPLPVSGDFENGFADDPDGVAETVRLAGSVGLSGCSVEDTRMVDGYPTYAFDLAVERIRAAALTAKSLGRPFVLAARADGVMHGSYDLAEGIRRLQAFAAAGADLLYLPRLGSRADLAQVLAAVEKPVNALASGPFRDMTVAELAAMGVRRISVGAQVARLTHAVLRDSVGAMFREGAFTSLHAQAPAAETDALMAKGARVQ